jgi:hypothetical protein
MNKTYNFSSNCAVASVLKGSFGSRSLIFLASSRICLDNLLYLQKQQKQKSQIMIQHKLQHVTSHGGIQLNHKEPPVLALSENFFIDTDKPNGMQPRLSSFNWTNRTPRCRAIRPDHATVIYRGQKFFCFTYIKQNNPNNFSLDKRTIVQVRHSGGQKH